MQEPKAKRNIWQRKDGRFTARCIVGVTDEGRARYRDFYGKTIEEVETKLEAIGRLYCYSKRETVQQIFRDTAPATSLDEVLEVLKMEFDLRGFTEKTKASYISGVRKFVVAMHAENNVQALTMLDAKNFILNQHKVCGMSPATCNGYMDAIRCLFVFALGRDIHQIIPGGVLTSTGQWRKSSDKFLLPVKAMRRIFRGKFLHYLKKIHGDLLFRGDNQFLRSPAYFDEYLSKLYQKEWVVYSKAPFKTADHLLDYLGRYTHRVAISNNRIVSCENGKISFKWRDRRDDNKEKLMTLDAVEFIRRVLMHVLPARFMKIRHYGFLSNTQKQHKLRLVQRLTNSPLLPFVRKKLTACDIMLAATGRDICLCQHCGGLKHNIHSRASPAPNNFIRPLLSLA